MPKRHQRTYARRHAVQVLYQNEMTGASVEDIVSAGIPADKEAAFGLPASERPSDYALELAHGVMADKDSIDAMISEVSENWSLDRMPTVDRAIIRMAVFEMLHEDDVPVSVSINEAVELAKAFGGEDDSARFANGILGRIAKNIDGGGEGQLVQEGFDELSEDSCSQEPAAQDAARVAEDEEEGGNDER